MAGTLSTNGAQHLLIGPRVGVAEGHPIVPNKSRMANSSPAADFRGKTLKKHRDAL